MTKLAVMEDERIYVRVIVPLRLSWEPYYYVDKEAEGGPEIRPGTRVMVNFAGKNYHGVISSVGEVPDTDLSKIKRISKIESSLVPVSQLELKLWRFVSEYYLCSIGEVFKAAYPASKISDEQAMARLIENRTRRLDSSIETVNRALERLRLMLEKKREVVKEARQGTKRRSEAEAALPRLEEEIAAKEAELSTLQARQKETEALHGAFGGGSGKEAVIKTGITLSEAQKRALAQISGCFSAGKPALLQGVTGSGKTEIYISLAAQAMNAGKNVLYLVPEIAVSRQLEERLAKVFGDSLQTFHSAESLPRRREVAAQVRSGNYIVLGTRSALFLPHHDLGLVIVDEEHDTSYKQTEPAPRYNGRDTAVMLANICGAKVLLGSATPSLDSLYNAEIERYGLVRLNERYYKASDAEVQIIDTIAERKKRGMVGSFSRRLIAQIRKTLDCGEQVMILRGRRSYAPSVQCENCGDIPKCPNCNVALSLHRTRRGDELVCHYCGHTEPFTAVCGKCGGELKPFGTGTQKVEEEARALFPDAVIERLDGDSALEAGYEERVIRDFSAGRVNILIGTQIVSKGFDFEGLSLVAILQADSLFGQQDFRADEHAVQLLEQFRGRSGRRGKSGLFVIQTSRPEHPAYACLEGADVVAYQKAMLDERRQFGYPPYFRLITIIMKDASESRLALMSQTLADTLRSAFGLPKALFSLPDGAPVQIIGPYSPVVDKVSGLYIRHIRITLSRDKNLSRRKGTLALAVENFERERKYAGHIMLDVDPS